MAYRVVYADCPWAYRGSDMAGCIDKPGSSAYRTMTPAELFAFDVPAAREGPAVLFAWATAPKLAEAFAVMRAWGFAYRGVEATWIKTRGGKRMFGVGWYTASNVEFLLVGTRGLDYDPPNDAVEASAREHSVKPRVFRNRVVAFAEARGLGRPIELFARGRDDPRLDYSGDQVESGPARVERARTGRRTRAELSFERPKRARADPPPEREIPPGASVALCAAVPRVDPRRPLLVVVPADHARLDDTLWSFDAAGLEYVTVLFVATDARTVWLAGKTRTFMLRRAKARHRSQLLAPGETVMEACRSAFRDVVQVD